MWAVQFHIAIYFEFMEQKIKLYIPFNKTVITIVV